MTGGESAQCARNPPFSVYTSVPINSDGAGAAAPIAFRITAANLVVPETACVCVPLNLGASTDTLYVSLYGTGARGAASVQCFVAGQSVTVQYAGSTSAPEACLST